MFKVKAYSHWIDHFWNVRSRSWSFAAARTVTFCPEPEPQGCFTLNRPGSRNLPEAEAGVGAIQFFPALNHRLSLKRRSQRTFSDSDVSTPSLPLPGLVSFNVYSSYNCYYGYASFMESSVDSILPAHLIQCLPNCPSFGHQIF